MGLVVYNIYAISVYYVLTLSKTLKGQPTIEKIGAIATRSLHVDLISSGIITRPLEQRPSRLQMGQSVKEKVCETRMPHPRGKRSPKSEARSFILNDAREDKIKDETISLVTESMVVEHLNELYPDQPPPTLDVVRGEVLIDSRGEGSFQK
jgi:hypothetical protein